MLFPLFAHYYSAIRNRLFISTQGTRTLTGDNVKQIQKGVTTRQQVEAMFGLADMVSMAADGKRVIHYQFSQSDSHITPTTFIPFAGVFLAGSKSQVEVRTLQIIFT